MSTKRDGLLETGEGGAIARESVWERVVRELQLRTTTILMPVKTSPLRSYPCTPQLLFQPLGGADWLTRTVSVVAQLLRNNWSTKRLSIFLSPAPPPCSWSLLGSLEGLAPPPSSWSRLDSVTSITGAARCTFCDGPVGHCAEVPQRQKELMRPQMA